MKYRIGLRNENVAVLFLECANGAVRPGGVVRECAFSIWQREAGGAMWHWDGNIEQPTITPSIDCHGGCGRHFTLIKGVPT